jgi:site-specific DNA recombinase
MAALNLRPTRPRHVAPVLPRFAALYCRVSSKHQATEDKASLPTQLAALRQKAAKMGYAVDEAYIYQDAHTGEELAERPGISALREDARGRHFGLVLAYNTYALAKVPAHLGLLVDEWQRLGITLDFVTEKLDDTPLGQFIASANSFAAAIEGERRKDRFQRARRARAESGKPATTHRPNYGYQWADVRLPDGRLSRERLEINPTTGPAVVRMFQMAAAGQTLRSMAHDLSLDGIPTPTGKHLEWDQTTLVRILRNPLYCGQGMALRNKMVPVDKAVRHLYAHRTREVRRPVEEQVPLPATYAPALVSRALFDQVGERLRLNQQLATRNDHQPAAALARGLIRCGHCGIAVFAMNWNHGKEAPRYVCGTGARRRPGMERCAARGITINTPKLDAAIWAKVCEVLSTPDLIAREVAAMDETEAPGTDELATIDRRLAEVDRRIATKRKLADQMDDDQEIAELAAEINALRRERRDVEAERVGAEVRASGWHRQQEGLQQTLDWCQRVSGNLAGFTFAERRATLLALRAEVRLYKSDHDPRAELTLHLPVSGARVLALGAPDSVNQQSSNA